jgi:hypothetical protein
MLKSRMIIFGVAVVALVGGLSVASVLADASMQTLGRPAPSQVDTLDLMTKAPAGLPVQAADAI